MVKIIPLAEAGQQIQEIVRQAESNDDVFVLTSEREPRAALIGLNQYESLLARLKKLEEALTQISRALTDISDSAVTLPTPDGGRRPFRPTRPVSLDTLALIQEAGRLARQRQNWTVEATAAAGEVSLARAQAHALATGNAIDDVRESPEGD